MNSTARRQMWLEKFGWVFVGFALAALAVIIIVKIRPLPPPIAWLEYSDISGEYCPGDVVPYSIVMRIDRAGPIYVVSSVVRADDNADVLEFAEDPWVQHWTDETGLPMAGDTIVGQRLGTVFLTVIAKENVLFLDKDFVFVVPDLPPGKYVRNVAAGMWNVNGETTIRSQPFSIKESCP